MFKFISKSTLDVIKNDGLKTSYIIPIVSKRYGNTDATGFLQYVDASVSITNAGDQVPAVGGVVPPPEERPKYEITRNEEEWNYVSRLLPSYVIPTPKALDHFPSGWVPPSPDPNCRYFVKRTRNHMIPVYLCVPKKHRGLCRNTIIRHIHGDIWALTDDLIKYLQPKNKNRICAKIHEVCNQIIINGDHVSNTINFLLSKKF